MTDVDDLRGPGVFCVANVDDVVSLVEIDGRAHHYDLTVPFDVRTLSERASSTESVFLFAEAKPVLKNLRRRGVIVRRCICLKTLRHLLRLDDSASAFDPAALFRDVEHFLDALSSSDLGRVARLENLILPVFASMEDVGLYVNRAKWSDEVSHHEREMRSKREEVFASLRGFVDVDLFGTPNLNLDSETEVRQVLSRKFGHSVDGTSKWSLATVDDPAVHALLAYREHAKIVQTYGASFLSFVGDDSRLRATFVPLGASTGRVACHSPNLQNLPSSTPFTDALKPPPGRALITADYGTCELRIVAELAGETAFLDAFVRGDDLHAVVATRMFQQTVSKTEAPELRQRAKAINFGLIYGMGAKALARQLDVDDSEGETLLAQYFRAFPRIGKYLEESVDTALEKGYAESILGRRLYFDEGTLSSENARGELSRIAKNMPIQGTSADMTKLAMVRVHEALRTKHDAALVNTIHDELVIECSVVDAEECAVIVKEEMETAHRTLLRRAPPHVDVDVQIGNVPK